LTNDIEYVILSSYKFLIAGEGATIVSFQGGTGDLSRGTAIDRDALELINTINKLILTYRALSHSIIHKHNISSTMYNTFFILEYEGTMSLNQLARKLSLDKSTVSRMVDTLQIRGFVKKSPDPGDGRVIRLEISERGAALYSIINKALAREIKGLPASSDREVRKVLKLFTNRLSEKFE
jgi:DNA-binding MarR family transcriptional regulator